MADVIVSGPARSTVYLFRPVTDAAREWIEENVDPNAQWFGGAVAVEHRYADALIVGLSQGGLTLERRFE